MDFCDELKLRRNECKNTNVKNDLGKTNVELKRNQMVDVLLRDLPKRQNVTVEECTNENYESNN